jgi:DNA-binding NarL/FixJ family response regulator
MPSETRVCPDAVALGACDHCPVAPSVLIVDDHADFRTFARALLQRDGFDVVGEAADGESALVAARSLKPGVVLLDIQLPDLDGFAVCERLVDNHDAPVVVLTSSRGESSYRGRLESSRAAGFVPKDELSGAALTALMR